MTVAEFIPKGAVVLTKEQFPDLDSMMDEAPKKSKKGGKKKIAEVPKAEEVVDETTAWKGKSSTFFVLQNKEGPVEDTVNNPMNFDLSNA
jgi:hypothetical protein